MVGFRATSWNPDGRRIVVGSHEDDVTIWDTETGQIYQILRGHAECGFICSVAWDPIGSRVAASCFVNHVLVWDADSGALLHRFDGPQIVRPGRQNNVA